ncbi:MAG: DNA mismatch repair protein MutS [Dehalococcoidia bacterium]
MSTPLRRQYLDIKRRYPHAILFFRLGDFYETFDEDAEVVARELEITLTSRPVSKEQRVPLAGIPHHSLEPHLAKLIAKGYKVAICEQTEAPQKGKQIVDRQVVRVVTPGTLVEDNLLDAARNNYLAALIGDGGGMAGLAYVDVSTAEFACLQGADDDIRSEIERLRPSELLLAPNSLPPPGLDSTLTRLDPGAVVEEITVDDLLRHFSTTSLEGIGLAGHRLAAVAAGVVLSYLKENQPTVLGQIGRVLLLRPGAHMLLDANTRRNLELFDPLRDTRENGAKPITLLRLLDETKTPMGARLLRKWLAQPLLDPSAIEERQDSVQLFFDSAVRRGRAMNVLARIPDLERALARISTASAGAPALTTPRDLNAVRRGLEATPELRDIVSESGGAASDGLTGGLRDCTETAALIAAAINDDTSTGVIRSGFSGELDSLRATAKDARQYLADLERRERERTGIKTLKIGYNRVFGYYIEVSKSQTGAVPDDYLRKQTLVGGERYTTPELQEHEYKVLHAEELRSELENRLLGQVCNQVAAAGPAILETAAAVARIDVACSLAEVAANNGYTRPIVDDGAEIIIESGRHAVVERMPGNHAYVPNDVRLSSNEAQIILLTGPNMAGKSTYLRQVALIVIMAQVGSFVPAREARIGIVDRIFSRVGALDDIAAGQSTFMVEMLETAAMLHGSTARSLLIFDEIGRGTSTYDGMAIARAVAEYIHNRREAPSRTLFATHYHELTEMASTFPRLRNFNVAVAEENGEVVFLHRIVPGGADRSYGVHVAQLAGLPRPVVARARELLQTLEAARGSAPTVAESAMPQSQLGMFTPRDDGLRRDLSALDPDSMTPLEALRALYELAAKARDAV